jgi:hypothetical protein
VSYGRALLFSVIVVFAVFSLTGVLGFFVIPLLS